METQGLNKLEPTSRMIAIAACYAMRVFEGLIMQPLNTKSLRLEMDGNSLYLDGKKLAFSYRKLSEMRGVLRDSNAVNENNKDDQVYFMFREVCVGMDREVFEKHGVRYDVTIIPDYNLGSEFNKTLGHYHPDAEAGLSYTEVYEVIDGDALILLQRQLDYGNVDVKLAHAKAGDKVLIMPNYGHITINVGRRPLVMANLVSSRFNPNYKLIEDMHGGAIYALSEGSYVINRNYKRLSIMDAYPQPELEQISGTASLYDTFINAPEDFDFLNKPSILGQLVGYPSDK